MLDLWTDLKAGFRTQTCEWMTVFQTELATLKWKHPTFYLPTHKDTSVC